MSRVGLESIDDLPFQEQLRRGLLKFKTHFNVDRGAGKSMFMHNAIRHHLNLNPGGGMAYVSLEMDTADIVERIAAIQGGQDGTRRP